MKRAISTMSKTRLGYADFTHVEGITDYMNITIDCVNRLGSQLDVLDVPAGNGLVVDRLNELGHNAIGGDINDAREGFVRVNMEESFPFKDNSFDAVTCLEGIEHVLDGYRLLSELVRVLRPGGTIIISTPNTMNLYSRWWYFLYGYPFQFPPHAMQHVSKERAIDRGHINPMSYLRLRYLLESLDAEVVEIHGDRIKKKHLLPFLLPVFGLGWLLGTKHRRREGGDDENINSISTHLKSKPLIFSRSIVLVARKNKN